MLWQVRYWLIYLGPFHHFDELNEYNGLTKSLNFGYNTLSEQDFTFLTSITSVAYDKDKQAKYISRSFPPFEFEYQKHESVKFPKQTSMISC